MLGSSCKVPSSGSACHQCHGLWGHQPYCPHPSIPLWLKGVPRMARVLLMNSRIGQASSSEIR